MINWHFLLPFRKAHAYFIKILWYIGQHQVEVDLALSEIMTDEPAQGTIKR